MNILTQYDPRTYAIIRAAMEVHRQLSCGFLEPIYHEALTLELVSREIPVTSQLRFRISYKDRLLQKYYRDQILFVMSLS